MSEAFPINSNAVSDLWTADAGIWKSKSSQMITQRQWPRRIGIILELVAYSSLLFILVLLSARKLISVYTFWDGQSGGLCV